MTEKTDDKTNWVVYALMFAGAYLTAVMWVRGPEKIWDFVSREAPLHNMGDFFAGVFALPAFVLLVAAVLTQRQELNLTKDELAKTASAMDEQVALARASADANWKLSLFQNRIEIYNELMDISRELSSAGPVDTELMVRVGNLSNRMKFVFSSDFQSWVRDIQDEIDLALRREHEWRHFSEIVKRSENVTADTESQKKAYYEMLSVQNNIKEKLNKKEIEDRFDSSLILPHTIEPIRDVSRDQRGNNS